MELKKNPAMTFDEVSMERSKSFVKALQELKNLRPQLYSAADYCEKSYLNSEQKQMVLDNLKDYAVRALVNAVDHLGTVAYKLTDLLDQQTSDVSTIGVKVSSISQQLLTCQTFIEKEGLRQQQLLAIIPRHHKHYVLPNSVSKKVHFSPQVQTDARQNHIQARSRLQPSGTASVFLQMNYLLVCDPCSCFFSSLLNHVCWQSESPASKTLSWHISTEAKPTIIGSRNTLESTEDSKYSGKSSTSFQLLDKSDNTMLRPTGATARPSSTATQPFGAPRREGSEGSKNLGGFKSFDNPRRDIVRAPVPVRSKSVLSAFFAKQKTPKLTAGSVS
ncbi:Protein ABIL1 [Linum perenne]